MASPSKPSDFSNLVLTSSATLCDRFKAVLLSLPSKLYDLANYVLDADGNPSIDFAKDLMANTGMWSIGDIKTTAAQHSLPDGWLECDGDVRNRTGISLQDGLDYSELYAAIGTSYGDGDGVDTFNLPDMRAQVMVGYNYSQGQLAGYSTYAMGERKGEEEFVMKEENLPAHNHVHPQAVGMKIWHDDQHESWMKSKRVKHFGREDAFAGVSHFEQLLQEVGESNPAGVSTVQPCVAFRFLIFTGVFTTTT